MDCCRQPEAESAFLAVSTRQKVLLKGAISRTYPKEVQSKLARNTQNFRDVDVPEDETRAESRAQGETSPRGPPGFRDFEPNIMFYKILTEFL